MSNNAFLSVIIPTMNRSHLIGFAIKSVLNQSFNDFEIVISDNDDSEILTRDVVASFPNPRIKYVRPPRHLSMHANWEFGLRHSTGRYITILEDKQALYPYALEEIYSVISGGENTVVTWVNDRLDDRGRCPVLRRYFGSGNISNHTSDEILSKFVNGQNISPYLPRMINSCVKRSLVDYVRQETPLGRFFNPVCPDLCAAFIQLNYVDEIKHIDRSLSVTGGTRYSTALSARMMGETAKRFIKDVGEDKIFCDYVPIKGKSLVRNVVINDYERIRKKLGGRLKKYTFLPDVYLPECYHDIVKSKSLGVDMAEEKVLWNKYFRMQGLTVRRRVRRRIVYYLARHYFSKWLVAIFGYNFCAGLRGTKKKMFYGYPDVLSIVESSEVSREAKKGR